MTIAEAPATEAVNAADEYHGYLMTDARGEQVPAVVAQRKAFDASVPAEKFHADRALAYRREDAWQAVVAADESAPRSAELRRQERSLAEAEQAAVAEVEAELRAEFERCLAEATEAARKPLAEFKKTNAAELTKLAKISKAAAEGRELLLKSADPMIDVAIEKLQNAEPEIWSGLAVRRAVNAGDVARRDERERQIEKLRLLKLEPKNFQHAASSPWRSFEPGDAASRDASS